MHAIFLAGVLAVSQRLTFRLASSHLRPWRLSPSCHELKKKDVLILFKKKNVPKATKGTMLLHLAPLAILKGG